MNKEKALERLDAIESEAKELREIIKAPELKEPEYGDLLDYSGNIWILGDDNRGTAIDCRDDSRQEPGDTAIHLSIGAPKNLGKFNEVYVKISDVRDALIDYNHISTIMHSETLRKLNII